MEWETSRLKGKMVPAPRSKVAYLDFKPNESSLKV